MKSETGATPIPRCCRLDLRTKIQTLRLRLQMVSRRVIVRGVSNAKLKQTVDVMTPAERVFVGAYLQHLARVDDPLHKAKLGQRMRRMDRGRKVSLEQARRLHRALEAEKL